MKRIIDIKKLKNAHQTYKGNQPVTIAQCPACAAEGYDLNTKDHLIIYPSGQFACVLNAAEEGQEHRKEILNLIGKPDETCVLPESQTRRPRVRPLNPIPTKVTYIKLKLPSVKTDTQQ